MKEKHHEQAITHRLRRQRPKEGSDKKPVWREIGAIWPYKNGAGFDLVLIDQISVSGRIVCTERKEKSSEQAAA